MNDYQNIYLDHLSYLKERLDQIEADPGIKKVVVSHHAPTRLMLNPAYDGDLLGTAYANQLDDLIISHPKIASWISGHTHHSQKMTLGSSLLLRTVSATSYRETSTNRPAMILVGWSRSPFLDPSSPELLF